MDNDYFVHDKAICETKYIGKGSRIWAFSHILPNAVIGKGCNICDHVFIENDVVVGNNVTVKCGVQLWDGLRIEDDVFIGPNATFTNDKKPRSKQYPNNFLTTTIRAGASIGANATILPGIEIGVGAMVGAGAVITKSVPPYALAIGNPARITGYVNTNQHNDGETSLKLHNDSNTSEALMPGGSRLVKSPIIKDIRGSLSVGEFEKEIPFNVKRYFIVYDVPSRETRGEHAHKECEQFLVCIKGSCNAIVDDGMSRTEVLLDSPSKGLYMPAKIWGTQYKYSKDTVLLVFTSHYYDSDDYIRDYDEFIKFVR